MHPLTFDRQFRAVHFAYYQLGEYGYGVENAVSLGNKIHIGYSDCGLGLRHFFRTYFTHAVSPLTPMHWSQLKLEEQLSSGFENWRKKEVGSCGGDTAGSKVDEEKN